MFKVKGLTLAALAIGFLGLSQFAFSNEIEKYSDCDSADSFELMNKEKSFELKLKERNAAILQAQLKSLDWIRQKTLESKRAALNYLFAAEKASYEMLISKADLQGEREKNNCFN